MVKATARKQVETSSYAYARRLNPRPQEMSSKTNSHKKAQKAQKRGLREWIPLWQKPMARQTTNLTEQRGSERKQMPPAA
jgi:hypothetical protein